MGKYVLCEVVMQLRGITSRGISPAQKYCAAGKLFNAICAIARNDTHRRKTGGFGFGTAGENPRVGRFVCVVLAIAPGVKCGDGKGVASAGTFIGDRNFQHFGRFEQCVGFVPFLWTRCPFAEGIEADFYQFRVSGYQSAAKRYLPTARVARPEAANTTGFPTATVLG
jgi:hypothetical protein